MVVVVGLTLALPDFIELMELMCVIVKDVALSVVHETVEEPPLAIELGDDVSVHCGTGDTTGGVTTGGVTTGGVTTGGTSQQGERFVSEPVVTVEVLPDELLPDDEVPPLVVLLLESEPVPVVPVVGVVATTGVVTETTGVTGMTGTTDVTGTDAGETVTGSTIVASAKTWLGITTPVAKPIPMPSVTTVTTVNTPVMTGRFFAYEKHVARVVICFWII